MILATCTVSSFVLVMKVYMATRSMSHSHFSSEMFPEPWSRAHRELVTGEVATNEPRSPRSACTGTSLAPSHCPELCLYSFAMISPYLPPPRVCSQLLTVLDGCWLLRVLFLLQLHLLHLLLPILQWRQLLVCARACAYCSSQCVPRIHARWLQDLYMLCSRVL